MAVTTVANTQSTVSFGNLSVISLPVMKDSHGVCVLILFYRCSSNYTVNNGRGIVAQEQFLMSLCILVRYIYIYIRPHIYTTIEINCLIHTMDQMK